MFFSLTPEMIERYKKYKNQTIPTFNEYYNTHYYNEMSEFYKNFRFSLSFKNMMIIGNLQNVIRNKIMKDYINKYPTATVVEDYTLHEKNIPEKKEVEETEESYDIVETEQSNISQTDNVELEESPSLRRSTRLRNKSSN